MADLGLKTFNKLYPMMIRKYQDLIVDQNATEKDKINQIIQKLNALGKLSNDVVRDWNTVYQWAMNDGLATDVNNKIEALRASGELNTILQSVFNALTGDMTTLHTTAKDTTVNAINEVNDLAKQLQINQGDLTTLQTTDKDSLVHAINDNVTQLNQMGQQKADTTYVDTKTAAVASGSPKGVFSTLNQLQTAYPTGTTGAFLVTGNVKEVDSLNVTVAPTTSGNVTVTLNGVATNIAVTAGVAEVDSLTISAGATTAGNITITLNGVATTVAVAVGDTAGAIGDKIRATAFSGWTVGGTVGSATVTFTKTTVGTNTAPTFVDTGATGTTGTFAVTTAGINTDTTTTVATKIRGTSFSGWTTGGTGTSVTFTATTAGVRTTPSYSAGTTGTTGTMSVTTAGVNPDGNWYYWNGSIWTAGGVYQGINLPDGSVNPQMSTFFTPYGINLFNKYDANNLKDTALDVNGGAYGLAGFSVTHYITVSPNTVYRQNLGGSSNYCTYDSNKTFIARTGTGSDGKFTTGANVAYIRMIVSTSSLANMMVIQGSIIPSSYIPYHVLQNQFMPDIATLQSRAGNLEAFVTPTVNLFDKTASGIQLNTTMYSDGSFGGNTSYNVLDFIPVTPNTSYKASEQGVEFYLAYDINKNFIARYGTGSFGNFTTDANTYYVKMRTLSTTSLDSYMLVQGNTLPTYYTPYKAIDGNKIVYPDRFNHLKSSTWIGKKWTSFGHSIVAMERWQPSVLSYFEFLSHTNRGIGGTTVANTGSIAWVDSSGGYVDRPLSAGGTTNTQPANTTQIYSSFCTDDRVNTIPTDAQLVTIMGERNDYAQNIPLGTINDTVDTTYYGGLITLLNKLYTRIPNARIILMTNPCSSDENTANSLGFKMEDYRKATREVANKFGYPVIEIKANMGVNTLNISTYSDDGTHPNTIGGQRLAEVAIGGLKVYQPLS